MPHVYDFITDEFQYQLKAKARQGNTRFEGVLHSYRTLFLKQLQDCRPADPPRRLPKDFRENKAVAEWLEHLHDLVVSETTVAQRLLDEVINGYLLFLHGKHFLATLLYQDLLESHRLLLEDNPDHLSLQFRGTDLTGDDPRKFWHIPYDSRHLVKNQRFSFSGIPFLYLGASVADIFFEFGHTDLNSRALSVASFAFNPVANLRLQWRQAPHSGRTRICNITNLLFNHVNDIVQSLPKPPAVPVSDDHLRVCFRLLVLAQLCTFPRLAEGSPFCEEYVIPQLFTEALRMHKYDGIVFSSTAFSEQKVVFDTPFSNLRYKGNVVWFTEYDEAHTHDERLMTNFEITVKNLQGYGTAASSELRQEIGRKSAECLRKLASCALGSERTRTEGVLADVSGRMRLYEGMKINGELYLNTYAGKLELVYTLSYLSFLESCISQIPVGSG
jgi:hypothetical protein